LIVAGLIVVCLAIYLQVWSFDFINLDDNLYVYENPFVRPGVHLVSIKWALTTFHAANWHPLTWISHMLDATLFGPFAGGHHIVNVVFHTANAVLAYFVFNRLTGAVWKSALIAFLFAVHPVHVESVAWVSERKDVLSTLFWLLTMLAYITWSRNTEREASFLRKVSTESYVLIVVAFAFGLMSKPMLVTLPFVLLLLDYWPLERLKTLGDLRARLIEKSPLFLLSVVSSYLTLQAQAGSGAIVSSSSLSYATRFANAAIAYVKYIVMAFYPADLAIGYSYPASFEPSRVAGALIVLVAITALCVWQRRSRPYLIVGWLWFVGTLVPVIGLVQVGAQSMADRYTYVPYFGLFLMTVWAAGEATQRFKSDLRIVGVASVIVILALSVLAFKQTAYWSDSYRLYTRSVEAGNANFLVHYNLCNVLIGKERLTEAEPQCLAAIDAEPRVVDSYTLLGMIYARSNRSREAIEAFGKVIDRQPNDPTAHANLAVPLMLVDETDEAQRSLDKALELYRERGIPATQLALSYSNLAGLFAQKGDYGRAGYVMARAVELDPNRADFRTNLARAYYFQDRIADARAEIDRAVALNQPLGETQNVLGMILLKQGDRAGAVAAFERAVKLRPDLEEAKQNLEKAKKAG
jgi:tetratricopeptide (TPR) repeat protein